MKYNVPFTIDEQKKFFEQCSQQLEVPKALKVQIANSSIDQHHSHKFEHVPEDEFTPDKKHQKRLNPDYMLVRHSKYPISLYGKVNTNQVISSLIETTRVCTADICPMVKIDETTQKVVFQFVQTVAYRIPTRDLYITSRF